MPTIVVAYNADLVIGNKINKLPWYIPEDLKFFKDITMGHACVMGKNTWESIPPKYRPLSGRYNVIVTRGHREFDFPESAHKSVAACVDVETAIRHAKQYSPGGEVFITGGAQIYNYCIEHNLVDRVLASEIKGHLGVEAGVYFPDLKKLGWKGKLFKEFEQFTVIEYTK